VKLKHHVVADCHNVLSASLLGWSDWHLWRGCMVCLLHCPAAVVAVVETAAVCGMDWGQVKGDDVMILTLET